MNEDFCTIKRKKANLAFVLSIFSICLFGLSLWLSRFLTSTLDAIFVSVLLFVPSVVLLCKSEKKEKYSIYSLILNSLANGSVVSIYYMKIQKTPVLCEYLVLLLPLTLVLLAYLLFGFLQKGRQWFNLLLIVVHIALITATVIRWVRIGGTICSLTVFGLIFSVIYSIVFAVCLHKPSRPAIRATAIGSFGILGIVVVIVILLISDGEGIDGVFDGLGDLIGDALPSRKKTKP